MSYEILSIAAQLYEKSTWKGKSDREGHSKSSELPPIDWSYSISLPINGL